MYESVRQRLAALGIRSASREDLVRWFPPELAMERSDLDVETLGEVLACFVEHGLVVLEPAGEPAPAEARHLCQFYRRPDEMLEQVGAFLLEGLERGEPGIWVVADWLPIGRARAALRGAGAGAALEDGRLRVLTDADVYRVGAALRPNDEVIGFWSGQLDRALAAGAPGLRISGDGTWSATDADGWRRWVAYEHAVHEVIEAEPALTALCTYDLGGMAADQRLAVVESHDRTVLRRGRTWMGFDADEARAAVRALT